MTSQNMAALARGNELRLEGARIRGVMQGLAMDDSRRCAAELLLDPPEAIAHMRVGHFLSAIKRFGQHRAVLYMQQADLPPTTWDWRVGPLPIEGHRRSLTARQRRCLAAALVASLPAGQLLVSSSPTKPEDAA